MPDARPSGIHPPSDWLSFPGTKEVRQHPYAHLHGPLFRWSWKFWHFRLTRAGRWFLAITTVAVFVFGLYGTLDTQTYLPATYASCLWLAALPAFFRKPRVTVAARHAERIVAGTDFPVEVTVGNAGRRPLYDLNVHPWGLPVAIDAMTEEGTPIGTLAPGESRTVTISLWGRRRGVYPLPGFRVETDFPLGLVNAYALVRQPGAVMVYPNFRPLAHLELPTGRRYQPGGIALSSPSGDSFEYLGNRPWRDGDNPRDIDWRATARLGGTPHAPLIVREWREEYFLRVGILLDTHQPPGGTRAARARRAEALERAISVCAAVADGLSERDYLVDLFAAGPNLYHLTVGRGLAFREQILDILACVEGNPEEPLSVLAPRLAEDIPRLTTVICVLLAWDAPRQAFVEELRAQGVGVRVALIVDEASVEIATDPMVRIVTPAMVAAGDVAL